MVATGSRLRFRPNVPGLAEHGFSVDQLDDAVALDRHLQGLLKPPGPRRHAIPSIVGRRRIHRHRGGDRGAARRLRKILGKDAELRVVIVDRNEARSLRI
ncbi:hypothetical protein ACU4GH_17940 [Bradyrhizobium betae]